MFLRAAAARLRSLVAPGAPVAVAFAAALSLAAAAAVAAPIIEVSPSRFGFPAVTLGDTAFAPLVIANRGDAPLTVSAIDVPPGVEFKPTALPRSPGCKTAAPR